jgi:uncharacterized RDD family membrane protein YckC
MKCEKCNNEYPSQYYFTTPTVCNDCFNKLSPEEKQFHYEQAHNYTSISPYADRAGFGVRLGAFVIDIVIYSIIFIVAVFASGIVNEFDFTSFMAFSNPALIEDFTNRILPLSLIITFIYFSMEIFLAATPGKMILGLVIANDDKTKASLLTLFIRFLLKHVDFVISVFVFLTSLKALNFLGTFLWLVIFVGCFFVLAEKRQSFHDMLANTAVYRKEDITH